MTSPFNTMLHELAVTIAKEAAQESTPLTDRLDAFKALNAYYATLAKLRGKAGDEPEGSELDGPSLADLASRLHEVNTSGAADRELSSHRKRRNHS